MKTIVIIAGGKSPEHDVSVISARNIYTYFDKNKYHVEVLGISKNGEWFHLPSKTLFTENLEIGTSDLHKKICFFPFDAQPLRYVCNTNEFLNVDVFFPITHGVYGEDGFIQGMLEYANKPYVGPGVLGSAIGMDKDVSKQLLQQNNIAVTPWFTYFKGDEIDYISIEKMGFPLFVKPANMGSGVGVEKADSLLDLKKAIENAFKYDIKILIEKGIKGREIETAVLGNLKTDVTGVGEIIVKSGFYTYENKYINGETQVVIPAENLSENTISLIKKTAQKAYKVLQLEGLSRVDFFYVSDTEFYLNEVNTLPGFTNISMYPKLWEQSGLPYQELLSKLVDIAQERFDMRNELKRDL
ncbi:MAG: D-alanine--D-alanine ligase family protein [Bacteroidota bacterium]|nr:D-alanine--D-alanine ligase family protein [Bacteroidota bacterium]